jgi:Peptidase family M28/PDZ domain
MKNTSNRYLFQHFRIALAFVYLFSLTLVLTSTAQTIQVENVRKHLTYLASDELKGRGTGTKDEIKAANYLADYFKQLGLQAKGTNGFIQIFKANIDTVHTLDARNVVAYLDNGASRTIVIGAHYDHLGEGYQRGSLDPAPMGKIHNGADDNASGVAGVMELARYYTQNKIKEKHNFLFVCFSGEELGLLGSKYYANNPTIDLTKMELMVNLDMIGRYEDAKGITIGGWGTSSQWGKIIPPIATREKMRYKVDSAGAGPSDHTSFYVKNRPVLFFFTGVHGDYHKPNDDTQFINFEGEAKVLKLIVSILDTVDTISEPLDFKETAMPMARNMKFKVTMGVLPDYSFNGPGLKIDGVSRSRPAEAAGLKAGDLLLRLGDYTVNTIYDYMGALGKFEKGQTVDAEVQRGNEKVVMKVTF